MRLIELSVKSAGSWRFFFKRALGPLPVCGASKRRSSFVSSINDVLPGAGIRSAAAAHAPAPAARSRHDGPRVVRPRRERDARVAPHRRGGVVVRARRALRARVHHPHVDAHAARLGVGDTAGRVAGVRGDAAAAVGAGGGDAPPLARAPARGGRRRGGRRRPLGRLRAARQRGALGGRARQLD